MRNIATDLRDVHRLMDLLRSKEVEIPVTVNQSIHLARYYTTAVNELVLQGVITPRQIEEAFQKAEEFELIPC